MTLLEILDRLPTNTASHLERLLDRAPIPEEPTKEEVLRVAENIMEEIKDCETDGRVIEILEHVPQAVVDQLFG